MLDDGPLEDLDRTYRTILSDPISYLLSFSEIQELIRSDLIQVCWRLRRCSSCPLRLVVNRRQHLLLTHSSTVELSNVRHFDITQWSKFNNVISQQDINLYLHISFCRFPSSTSVSRVYHLILRFWILRSSRPVYLKIVYAIPGGLPSALHYISVLRQF